MCRLAIASWARAAALVAALCVAGCRDDEPKPTPEAPEAPATPPATQPTAQTSAESLTYLDVFEQSANGLPTTRPLDVPLPLSEAAAVELHQPVIVDSRGVLWITDPGGTSVDDIVSDPDAWRESDLVVQEHVTYARTTRRGSETYVEAVTIDGSQAGWHHATGSAPFDIKTAAWDRAFLWSDAIVVPTDSGISVVRLLDVPEDAQQYWRRYGDSAPEARPDGDGRVHISNTIATADDWLILPAGERLLAWSAQAGQVETFDGETWSALPEEAGWTSEALHFVTYVDGSVAQITPDGIVKSSAARPAAGLDG